MAAKVTKSKNIFSGKNAKVIPAPKRSHHKKVILTIGTYHPKPIGKPATILYKKLPDDMILITGFENFLDVEAILDKYGRRVASTYTSYPYNMSGITEAIFLTGLQGVASARIGYVCSKDTFSKLIAHVKKCGGLLHDIIQAVNGGEVKRIEI